MDVIRILFHSKQRIPSIQFKTVFVSTRSTVQDYYGSVDERCVDQAAIPLHVSRVLRDHSAWFCNLHSPSGTEGCACVLSHVDVSMGTILCRARRWDDSWFILYCLVNMNDSHRLCTRRCDRTTRSSPHWLLKYSMLHHGELNSYTKFLAYMLIVQ